MVRSTRAMALAAAAVTVRAAPAVTDPCTLSSSAYWVSSAQAHACELAVPFNQTTSVSVVDTAIKALQYYSTETWFLHSPNPKIPHDWDVRLALNTVKVKTQAGGYATDWDFNMAVTDAFNNEWDGHTNYIANCVQSFSYNLPFSVATLAASVSDTDTAYPTYLVNYDFPNQGRPGLEAYYQGLGFDARKYDGFRIMSINGQDASQYLIDLAQVSSIYKGLTGGYETLQPRYMRLMARYSADTPAGEFAFEVGRFGMRSFYPGEDSVSLVLQNKAGKSFSITVPWAAHGLSTGNTTASFIANSCALPVRAAGVATVSNVKSPERNVTTKMAFVDPDNQNEMRDIANVYAKANRSSNYVKPNLQSYGPKVATIDIYRLKKHPKVGVLYMEQFAPSNGLNYQAYFNGVSDALYQGLSDLKKDGVEYLIIDQSGNRGGYIFAGAIAMWSLFPQDLYPGFPAVFRNLDLANKESKRAANKKDYSSEYFYGNYRDLDYKYLTNNKQFMGTQVEQTINGVKDYYSVPFFDDFGDNSTGVTSFTEPPFPASNIVFVANGICASTCSVFSSYLYQKHGVRSAVFGGLPNANRDNSQFDGGVKGSEVTSLTSILAELRNANLQDDPNAPQPLPIRAASFNLNFRNALTYIEKEEAGGEDGILEYVFEEATTHYQFTKQNVDKPQQVWEFVAGQYFNAATAETPVGIVPDAAMDSA